MVYPDSRTKFQVDKATGDLLLAGIKDDGDCICCRADREKRDAASELTDESLYKTGNLFRIPHVQPADDGYLVCAQVVKRVKAVSLTEKDGLLYAIVRDGPGHPGPRGRPDRPGSSRTSKPPSTRSAAGSTGSEQFTKPIDQMDSVDQIMGFVMPFLPVNLAEKQALLEIDSVRQRYITFLELLIRTRENINIRIEMAKKVSDKVSKSNREAMLREQLKVIQEELNESEGDAGDGGYREQIESSKMPDDVRKKALAEAKKLETGGRQNHESSVIRNYLDLLLDLPWETEEKKSIDIEAGPESAREPPQRP